MYASALSYFIVIRQAKLFKELSLKLYIVTVSEGVFHV